MKILFLSEYVEAYDNWASFRIRYISAKLLADRGHNVTYIYPTYSSLKVNINIEKCNLKLISTPGLLPRKLRTGGFSFLDTFYKTIFAIKGKFDVIHVTKGHRPAQLLPALAGKIFSNSIIIDEWWEWYGKGGYSSLRKGFIGKVTAIYDLFFELPTKRYYDSVIAITNVLKKRIINNNHIEVMHGGTEVDELVDYDIWIARTNLNLPEDQFIIGMSNLGEDDYTDNKLFFDAFEKIVKEHKEIRLFITGEKKYISKFISSAPYKDKIIYAGWLEFADYNKYLSACNIFVLPLRNNCRNAGRWPNKIGDYLCLNRPIITNPTGDLKEIFRKYKIGFICEESADGFYNLIKNIIEKKIELSKFSRDSKYLAYEILSFGRRIESILRLYSRLLERRES